MHESSFGRLVSVLVAPGKTFRSIAERPTWGVALAVLVILIAVANVLFMQKVDLMEGVRQQAIERGQEPPPAEMEGFIVGCSYAIGIIVPLLLYLGVPLIFWGAFTLLGGTLNYKTSLAVSLHAMMPLVVASLLSIPIIIGREGFTFEEMQTGSALASNLGHLAPEDASPVLVSLLSSVDVFSIWIICLLIIGYHVAAGVSKAKAAITVLAVWGVGILLKVGMAAFGAGGGGA